MSISTIASSYNSNTHQFSSPAVIRYIQKECGLEFFYI
ncbi:hypothetical protein OROMI_010904 [Orobanche minor]